MFNRENLITWMYITCFGDTMKKWSLFLILVLLLSLVPGASMGFVKGDNSLQHTVSITPTDDGWIDEGGYVDTRTYRLRVGTYSGSEARTYLKFNLSELGIPPEFIISATLKLYAYYHYGSKTHNITVYGVADNWNEYTIKWANKPQNLTNALDWQLGKSVYKWYSWNVTDFVKSEMEGDKVVSFMLHSNLSHEPIKDYIYFASKETSYTDEKPYLEIVYEIPETPQEPVVKYPKRSIGSIQYFYYLRYKEAIEKFDELYQKAVESGADEKTLKQALEYKELAEKEYELAWQFGHPLKGHFQTFVHMRKAYLHIKNAIEILEKAIEEVESL